MTGSRRTGRSGRSLSTSPNDGVLNSTTVDVHSLLTLGHLNLLFLLCKKVELVIQGRVRQDRNRLSSRIVSMTFWTQET